MALRNLVALFVLCAGCAGGSEQSPAVDEVAPVASVQAPTRLPRSLWEIKKKDTEVAWDHQAALSLATAARSEGHQIAGLFHPDQQGFGTIERLKLTPQTVVADIGCGTGPFVVGLLESGQPFEAVYAVDIDAPSLALLEALIAPMADKGKVKIVKSEVGSVGLERASIDVMLVDNASLHMAPGQTDPWLLQPDLAHATTSPLLASMRASLKPGGRLHVIQNIGPGATWYGEELDMRPVILSYLMAGFTLVSKDIVSADGGAFSGAHVIFSR